MKIIRILFYLGIVAASIGAIQMKKNEITIKKQKPVESVLSIMTEEGLPLTVYTVVKKNFVKYSLYNLLSCGDSYCFQTSLNEKNQFRTGSHIKDPKTDDKIGFISEIGTRPAINTGLYEIKVKTFVSINKANRFVKVEHNPIPKSIVIPTEAVIQLKEEAFVYILENGIPQKKVVHVDGIAGDQVRINKGVNVGDTIVVEGISQINLFDKFRIVGEWHPITRGQHQ